MKELDEKADLGFHEFFRYAIPGYGFVVSALVVLSINTSLISSFKLPEVLVGVITGPFIGFIISMIYYQIWFKYYSKNSEAYKYTKETIKKIPKWKGSSLEKRHDRDDQLELLARAIWDRVYFSEDNTYQRNRIQFIFTMTHSIGSTILSLWSGFLAGFIIRAFLSADYPLNINIDWSLDANIDWSFWLPIAVLFIVLSMTTVVLSLAFLMRKRLGEKEESLFVVENVDNITKQATDLIERMEKVEKLKVSQT